MRISTIRNLTVMFCLLAAIWSPEPIKWVLTSIYSYFFFYVAFPEIVESNRVIGSKIKRFRPIDFIGRKL
jgi:hypothetical protein